jgi:outer membrane lipoprotein
VTVRESIKRFRATVLVWHLDLHFINPSTQPPHLHNLLIKATLSICMMRHAPAFGSVKRDHRSQSSAKDSMQNVLRGVVLLLSLPSCANSDLVPTHLQSQVSRDISFGDIKANPERFKGRIVVIGGHVLSATQRKDQTEIEVLQLPLNRSDQPASHLMNSKGRFLAFSKTASAPAAVPPGSYVSMVAEVLGSQTALLDDVTYTYPTFAIKTFKVWPKSQQYARPFPFWDRWNYPFDDPWTYPYWGAY